ncbi:GNAT family N-acetyltransferase [Jannaschia formosa]|uniref:GNAT family N-acetyltransferase n=1 Tax=Jannaschia formosa TaxID=2259592 RepID=UPI000E1C0E53|nr:GNAT family N-acetyltransferase [Jannaschia formosa]TFL16063.1 GNAT family N-acetyltransferase [Jannaschia formosa]
MTLRIETLRGDALAPHLDALARLRIAVFRDWPYLYDGDMDYERQYLAAYRPPGAVVVGAFDGAEMVGAATAAPMERHAEDFAAAFAGEDLGAIYYLAESVLLPAFRGQGLGHRFFDAREAEARALGRRRAAFCSVIRPGDHPARPEGARSHDAFWRGRGYAPVPGAVAHFSWRDIGDEAPTEKPLQFWAREL